MRPKFWQMALVGLIGIGWAAWRVAPPRFLLPAGHLSLSYYPYSFLHSSYSDVVALYTSRHLYAHPLPYFQNVIEYPVLIGLYMWAMAWLPGFWGYFAGSAAGLMLAFVGALYVLRQGAGDRAAWWFALSPLLVVYGLLNWDLLGIATWGLAALAWRRERFGQAGLYLGLGTVTKFFPVVLVPYMLLGLTVKGARRGRRVFLGRFALGAVGINLPFALLARPGWSEFFTYNSGRGPVPGVYQWICAQGLAHIDTINGLSLALTLGGGLVLLWAVWKGHLEALGAGTAALVWWLLCNKVYSPQYMLWVYYALLWVDVNPLLLTAVNVAGLLDFFLAMRWLALGTTGNPFLGRFAQMVPAPVIAFRDLTLLAAAALAGRGQKRVGKFAHKPR